MSQLSSDLLQQALHLAKLDAKKPKQANLRRAVSSAYYGLFHFLIEQAVSQVIGTANNVKDLRLLVSRAFVHGTMKKVCSQFCAKTPPQNILKNHWSWRSNQSAHLLVTFATTFIDLQEERHRADYDLTKPFTKAEAIALVDSSIQAMKDWNHARKNLADGTHLFCLSLLLFENLLKRTS